MAHILIVEDERALAEALARYLRSQGHEVRKTASAREAARIAGDMDLVLTDINMPDMDGIELIIELREHCPEVPVIAMSGGGLFDKRMLLDAAGTLGAVRLLEKPFGLDALEVAVMEVLRDTGDSS